MTETPATPADSYPSSQGPFAGPHNSFPVGTAARVRAAWSRIHQRAVVANHTQAEVADIKTKIKAAAKKFGITLDEHGDGGDSADNDSTTTVERMITPDAEVRFAAGGNGRTITGYAAVFNELSRVMSFGREILSPNCFDESRAAGWPGNQGAGVQCHYDHHPLYLLGSTHGGTLQLNVDHRGLQYSCDVPQHRDDVLELVRRRDIHSSSFTFTEAVDSFEYRSGTAVRTILSANIIEVSPVSSTAAYAGTSAYLRSLARHCDASVEEVRALADRDEIRKLFCDSRRTMTGLEAHARVSARRVPPGVTAQHDAGLALLELHRKRWAWH